MDTFDLLLNSEKYMNAIKFIEDQSGIKIMLDYHGEYIVEQRLKERISRLDIKTNDWINVFGNDYEKILK
ncbi:MAG: hypothetical protein LBK13_07155, partial [Spirochaetales bacterium]|nr:hypothetical protein [Spirochaetales bacterium]